MNSSPPSTLAIALGANISSQVGTPLSTLKVLRPQLEELICSWIKSYLQNDKDIFAIYSNLECLWSPLNKTKPQGGPIQQPDYINAVLVIKGTELNKIGPSEQAALKLLNLFLDLEKEYGRDRKSSTIKWGPRSLDLDLIAWGDLQISNEALSLPHPQLFERDFVLIPLAAAIEKSSRGVKQIIPSFDWE